jgi:hypothetical protein
LVLRGSARVGAGEPIRSRAAALTAFPALNFRTFLFAIAVRRPALAAEVSKGFYATVIAVGRCDIIFQEGAG